MNELMISCKRATELTEKRLHFGLSFSETLKWKIHIAICSACRMYSKQSALIEASLKHTLQNPSHVPPVTDADAERLKKKILSE